MYKVYHKIIQIIGNVICVEAENVSNNELAEVKSAHGTSLARVIRLDGAKVYLQVFAGSRGISTDDEIRFLGRPMQVSESESLLGRIFNGRGEPRDHRPAFHRRTLKNRGRGRTCKGYQSRYLRARTQRILPA